VIVNRKNVAGRPGEGHWQFARRIHKAVKDLGQSNASLHTRFPGLYQRIGLLGDPFHGQGVSVVQYHDTRFPAAQHIAYQFLLQSGEVQVAPFHIFPRSLVAPVLAVHVLAHKDNAQICPAGHFCCMTHFFGIHITDGLALVKEREFRFGSNHPESLQESRHIFVGLRERPVSHDAL